MQEIESYLSDLKLYDRSENTITATNRVLNNFAIQIDKSFIKVTPIDIKKWLSSMNGISNKTRMYYLQHVSTFFDHLINEGEYNEKNPVTKILKEIRKAPMNPVRLTIILGVDDVRKIILKASNPRDRALLLLFYKTGIRLSELSSIRIEDIDFDKKIITIQKRKGGKTGKVFFDNEAEKWLKAYINTMPKKSTLFGLKIRQLEDIVKAIGERAGIDNLNPHAFRHAFTTHLQGNRCHPEVIRELRGDSKRDMVSYYTHFTPEQVKEEYNRCIPKLGV